MNDPLNDEFLYSNRPPVREEFADRLYAKLSSDRKETDNKMIPRTFTWIWRFAAALVLIAIMLFTLSTGVRASVLAWIKSVAGFNVEERSESPLKGLEEEPILSGNHTPKATMNAMTQTTPEAISPTVYPVATAPLSQVLQNPPFKFGFPEYIPEGFSLNNDTGIANSGNWVMVTWQNSNGAEIAMLAEKSYSGYNIPAGVDSTRETQIDGKPALLIFGFWDKNHTWDAKLSVALHWQQDEIHYTLTYWSRSQDDGTIQPIENTDIAADELVKMAESIR